MKRVIAAAFVLCFASVAVAEPPANEKKAEDQKVDKKAEKAANKKADQKADQKVEKKADAATTATQAPTPTSTATVAGPADLQVKPQQALPGHIDLFPTTVMQHRSKTEHERRMTLGDDSDWRVQAAQVGAMVGIFGALVGLCGGGKCLVPKKVTDAVPLPGWMQSDEPVYSNPRREQTVRQAR